MSLHIDTAGLGRDVVLIHGWAMHGGIFHALAAALARTCRVHVVDLPGHGHSRDDVAGFDVVENADRLVDRLPPAIWIGWSLGGLVAMQAALTSPQRVRGLGMICASPRFVAAPDWPHGVPLDVFAQFGADLANGYRATLARFLALEVQGDEHAISCLRELKARLFERGEPAIAALGSGLHALAASDYRDALASLAVPSLWLAGSRDRLVPSAAMASAAKLAGGRFHRVARAGHAPFITHCDEVHAQIIALVAHVEAA